MIYTIDEWHKVDAQGVVVQQLFCLSDMHGAESVRPQDAAVMNKVDQEQRGALTDCLVQLKKDKALFIVEDPFGASFGLHKKIAAYLATYKPIAFNQPEGQKPILLAFLADILSQNGCDVINADYYRQQRGISYLFGVTLNNCRKTASPLTVSFHKNINTLYGTTLKEVAQEFKDGLDQAKTYSISDGPVLAACYESIITELEKTLPFADLLSSTSYFYWDLVDAAYASAQAVLQPAFLLWGLELVDMHTLHALYNAQGRSKVCIIMGGVHVNNISSQLPKLGYQKVRTVGEDSLTEQEYSERSQLSAQLFNVNRLIPAKPASWLMKMREKIAHTFSKNRVVTEVPVDQEKLTLFTTLNTKFCFAKPINLADFKMLVEPMHVSEVIEQLQQEVC